MPAADTATRGAYVVIAGRGTLIGAAACAEMRRLGGNPPPRPRGVRRPWGTSAAERLCARVPNARAARVLAARGLTPSPRRRDLVPVLIEQMHVRDGQPHTDTLSHPLKRASVCLAHRLADKIESVITGLA